MDGPDNAQSSNPEQNGPDAPEATAKKRKVPKKVYFAELERLQTELVKLQSWIKTKGLKIVVIFEGRVESLGAGRGIDGGIDVHARGEQHASEHDEYDQRQAKGHQ